MGTYNNPSVLAIGIDAAEPTLIRSLMDEGEMPVLKRLLDDGKWLRIESPAHIGSGAVWPTFITGEEPATHGVYAEWRWQPETMSAARYHGRDLIPFWQALASEGVTVGVLDVPFAPVVGLSRGFEIAEWWAHDELEGKVYIAPREVAQIVNGEIGAHPLSSDRINTATPDSNEQLQKLSAACLQGIRLRGKLAQRLISATRPQVSLIVFPEIHHASHHLWHTVVPEHQLYQALTWSSAADPIKPSLKAIYSEMDQQIGRLVQAAGSGASLMVFSLHGMRPTRGLPSFLAPLLCESGYAQLTGWDTQSWRERGIAALAAVKRHTPMALKNFYYRTLPRSAIYRVAQPTVLPPYNWAQTRAFALPTDQHGWIRINLQGRESAGIVKHEEYAETCSQLENLLHGLQREDGQPLVRDVTRTAPCARDASALRLPDLVVHWEDAAFAAPLRIKGSRLEIQPSGKKFTGQHAFEGFCILKGEDILFPHDSLPAREMHRLIAQLLISTREKSRPLSLAPYS